MSSAKTANAQGRNIFIWVAHPNADSLCASLAGRYASGAKAKGANVRHMALSEMDFDMDGPSLKGTEGLEPDLVAWQQNVAWADHILIVHPYWWAAMPARAKAVLDRGLSSGFAYQYTGRGMGWNKLLKGRSGDAIITSDTPPLLDTLLYRKPGRRVLRNQVFDFVGIKARKILQLGSVKLAKPEKIENWLKQAEQLGMKAAR